MIKLLFLTASAIIVGIMLATMIAIGVVHYDMEQIFRFFTYAIALGSMTFLFGSLVVMIVGPNGLGR